MPIYDDLKKKAKEAMDTIADVSVEAYKIAEERAKILARRAVLATEITREKAAVRRIKLRIGDTYYNLHKDDPEEEMIQYCSDITVSLDLIADKRREMEELRNGYIVYDAEVEECECDEKKDEPVGEEKTDECDCGCQDEKKDDEAGEQ